VEAGAILEAAVAAILAVAAALILVAAVILAAVAVTSTVAGIFPHDHSVRVRTWEVQIFAARALAVTEESGTIMEITDTGTAGTITGVAAM